jgi:hypothetical protein
MLDDMAGSPGAIGSLGTTAENLRSPPPSMHRRSLSAAAEPEFFTLACGVSARQITVRVNAPPTDDIPQ